MTRFEKFQERFFSDSAFKDRISNLFWKGVSKGIEDLNTDCWPFDSLSGNGYGQINCSREYGPIGAHRIAYMVFFHKIPDGLDICHVCDNPACCHPCHLFAGTRKDNIADCIAKGRNQIPGPLRGEQNPSHKLCNEEVHYIKRAYSPKAKAGLFAAGSLARRFGVSPVTIRRIASGKGWAEIEEMAKLPANFLTETQKSEILSRFSPGKRKGPNTRASLAKEFGVPGYTITNLVRKHNNSASRSVLCSKSQHTEAL